MLSSVAQKTTAAIMTKQQFLKHLQRVAEQASSHKRLNALHVRAIADEMLEVWAKSLQETGSASVSGFGRFDIQKGKGTIKFTPVKALRDRLEGDVSSSAEFVDDEDDRGF
ncbi:hypothetical protein Poli38472_012994 [Pythium oligandrum]|uniref:Uncharacterized protein n=1 Tax=Pythium oligandrum TaxID=41045 RepID=A0A8K1CJ31_PYTOL|nr:hypothetical protein Poli38472_012994 [Pythium oligandrum]|eukprot:TMW64372.1 hypothetical protein Poli38472_012994 [Pythium oligandrum]